MKRLLVALCLALSVGAAVAAEVPALTPAPAPPLEGGGMSYLSLGSTSLNLDKLNDSLKGAGYPALSTNLSVGGAAYAFVGRAVLGGEGNYISGKTVTNGTYNASITAASGLFRLGYVALESERLRLYPMVGIGGGGVKLTLQQRSVPDFDQVIAAPEGVTLTTASLLLDLAVGADCLFTLGKDRNGEGLVAVGLQAGYTWAPLTSSWKMGEATVPNGPEVGLTGPYVKVVFGLGGRGKLTEQKTAAGEDAEEAESGQKDAAAPGEAVK